MRGSNEQVKGNLLREQRFAVLGGKLENYFGNHESPRTTGLR